jgi:uncharacterized protein YndB with AHSA1/START domain
MTGTAYELRLAWMLAAPPERVWRALTEPAALTAWFWPAHLAPAVTADVRVGGSCRIASGPAPATGAGGLAVTGQFSVVEPPRRLAVTWRWDGEHEQTLVTSELSGDLDGTRLSLTPERFADEASRDRHVTGWNDCLARLPAHLVLQTP